MTNADAIRQMTDDELYRFLEAFEVGDIDYALTFCNWCGEDIDCATCFRRWLFGDANDYNGLLADKGVNSGYADRKTEPQTMVYPQVDGITPSVIVKDEPQICDICRYYNSNIPCGSTPSACKKADKFAKEFVDGLKKLKPKDEPRTEGIWNAGYKTGYDKGYKDAQKVKDSQDLVKDLVKGVPQTDCDHKCIQTEVGCEQTDCPWM